MQVIEHKVALEELFAEGYSDFPFAKAERRGIQAYELGFSAHAEIEKLEEQRAFMGAKVKELSGGLVGRVGFI